MRFVLNKALLSIGLLTFGVVTFPGMVLGDDNNCNKFGAKCHVEDIKTIHTDDSTASANLLDTIQNAINRCLGILATMTLCICLYGGFQMLTSGSDSKGYDAGWKVLKNALLGLTIILLAWMIVSVVFWFVATMSGGNQTGSNQVV